MALPFFYIADYNTSQKQIILDEDTSRHVIQVLRMKVGEQLNLTDGKGNLINAEISVVHKKHCETRVIDSRLTTQDLRKVSIAISLLKNSNRFEWFLEKATELGVSAITPLLCERTEKEKFRYERMQQICISAMLQSQQTWLPVLHQPVSYELLFHREEVINADKKFIAHCDDSANKVNLSTFQSLNLSTTIILIGPEGDFTLNEIEQALQNHFIPVALGNTRLRTETAGIVAATLLRLV